MAHLTSQCGGPYAVVYDGEIWLELDNGETMHLKHGDVVVQNGVLSQTVEAVIWYGEGQ
jgi:hypothetical protein